MMNIFAKVCEAALYCATLGSWGHSYLKRLIASLFALPALVVLEFLCRVAPSWWFIFVLVAFIVPCIIIQLALWAPTLQDRSSIVLDHILGMAVAFVGISFHFAAWKVALSGIILFQLFLLMRSFLFSHAIFIKLTSMDNALGIVADDVLAGVVVNIIMRLLLWMLY